jgi:hypothetical protein
MDRSILSLSLDITKQQATTEERGVETKAHTIDLAPHTEGINNHLPAL